MTETEIEKRLPVWQAMSGIFLDTELEPKDHAWIADILRRSGFTPTELETIFETEVAPAFAVNRMSPAGEWAGWTEDGVRAIVLQHLRERWSAARWLAARVHRRYALQEWRKVASLL